MPDAQPVNTMLEAAIEMLADTTGQRVDMDVET